MKVEWTLIVGVLWPLVWVLIFDHGSQYSSNEVVDTKRCDPLTSTTEEVSSRRRLQDPRAVKTSIPMYYINLDRSVQRRQHMEETFASWGTLIRVAAVDSRNWTEVRAAIELDEDIFDGDERMNETRLHSYLRKVRSRGLGTLCLVASLVEALELAISSNYSVALVLEDDMSDLLVPYWRWSLEEIVALADKQHPNDWDVIQLHTISSFHRDVFQLWKIHPESPFVDRSLSSNPFYGGGAVLFSRKGMITLVSLLKTKRTDRKEYSRLDCTVLQRSVPCVTDHLLYTSFLMNGTEGGKVWKPLLVLPPLFSQVLNEGSTNSRSKSSAEIAPLGMDHEVQHYVSIFASLQSSIEAWSLDHAAEDLGNTTLVEPHKIPYMVENFSFQGNWRGTKIFG